MKKGKDDNLNLSAQESNNDEDNLPGYPIYPESEDIYSTYVEEKEINPEDIFLEEESIEESEIGISTEKDWDDESPDSDLDIPGAELDDDMEIIGSEDEENNYYSLGGDDHDDLEEDQGD